MVAVDSAKKYAGLYAKALAAAAVAGLGAYSVSIQDGSGISGSEALGIVVTVLIALGGVWAVPNIPEGVRVYGKSIVGALVAGLGVLGTSWTDGSLSQVEVVSAVVAFIVALGLVGVTSNAAASDPTTADGTLVPVTAEQKRELVSVGAVDETQVVYGD